MKMTLTTPSITRLHDEGSNQIAPDKGLPRRASQRFITLCSPRFFAVPTPASVSRIRAVVALRGVIAPCLGTAAVTRGPCTRLSVAWLVSEGVVLSATALSRSASLSLESRFGGSGFKKQESRDKT